MEVGAGGLTGRSYCCDGFLSAYVLAGFYRDAFQVGVKGLEPIAVIDNDDRTCTSTGGILYWVLLGRPGKRGGLSVDTFYSLDGIQRSKEKDFFSTPAITNVVITLSAIV